MQVGLKTVFAVLLIITALPDAFGQENHQDDSGLKRSAPGWNDLDELTRRLDLMASEMKAVKEENQILRNELNPSNDNTDDIINQAGYCETCGEGGCSCDVADGSCSWIDQLSNQCHNKLSWNKGEWRIVPFGQLRGEAIYSSRAQTADAVTFFLNPRDPRFDEDQFTIHGKTSMINFSITGPSVGSFQTGGMILMNFLGPQPIRNGSGINVLNAYGELKNDQWRFAFGRIFDLFSPIQPNTVNMLQQRGAGNLGIFRGALHVDRYFTYEDSSQLTLSGRISQQDVNDFLIVPTVRGTDNGIPNFEARIGYEFGPEIDGHKVIEVGLSGLYGQTRAVDPVGAIIQGIFLPPEQAVSDTWGGNFDFQVQLEHIGFRGEIWTGEAAGTYFMSALQSLNPILGTPIRSQGGWGEIYFKPCRSLTLHIGYGIDDPRNEDLGFFAIGGPGQRTRNQVAWGNAILNVTESFQLAFEVSHRETDYLNKTNSSKGMLYHFASTLKF